MESILFVIGKFIWSYIWYSMLFGLGMIAGWMMKPENDPNEVPVIVILKARHDLLEEMNRKNGFPADYRIPDLN
jgi:hypothetical protein